MQTTLNKIRAHRPCGIDPRGVPATGFQKLRNHLGHDFDPDKPFSLRVVFDSNGFNDTVWCLRAVEGRYSEKRLLAVRFAREVQHLMTDPRSIKALDVSEAFAHGLATAEELADAAAGARAAEAAAAYAAGAVARAARAAWATAFSDAAVYDVAAHAAAAQADAEGVTADTCAKQTEILLSFLEA